jgi:hypothetical protein
MREALLPLPNTRGAQLKHIDNFTLFTAWLGVKEREGEREKMHETILTRLRTNDNIMLVSLLT